VKRKRIIAGIAGGFLALMLVLLFFSNTILNSTLPVVRSQSVMGGAITPAVGGSGVVESVGEAFFSAESNLTVLEVLIPVGEMVTVGTPLLRVEYTDDGTLDQLRSQLKQAQDSYDRAVITAETPQGSGNGALLQQMQNSLNQAQLDLERCNTYLNLRAALDRKLETAEEQLAEAQKAYSEGTDAARAECSAAEQAYTDAEAARQLAEANAAYAESLYERDPGQEAQYLEAKAALDESAASVNESQNALYTARQTLDGLERQYSPALEAAQQAAADLQTESLELEQEYAGCTDRVQCENAVLSAQSSLASFHDGLAAAEISGELQQMDLKGQEETIAELEDKIAEIEEALGERTVSAKADGVLQAVLVREGDVCPAGTPLLEMENTADRYRVQVTVPKEEGAALSVGDTAAISGTELQRAVLEEIADGPTEEELLLTFSLGGDAASPGDTVTIRMSLRGDRYDTLVPNSALYEDVSGTFVYKLERSSSALGTRMKAERVLVTVLASDDQYSAVEGDLYAGETVILYASQPLSDGQQVRMEELG